MQKLYELRSQQQRRQLAEAILRIFQQAEPDTPYDGQTIWRMGGFIVNKTPPHHIRSALPKLMESLGWRRIKLGMRGRYIYHGTEFKPSTVAQRNRRAPRDPGAARRLNQAKEIARQVNEASQND